MKVLDDTTVQGQVRLNGKVNVTQFDIAASNGYIHHIDGLLTSDTLMSLLPSRCDVVTRRTIPVSTARCITVFFK